MSPDIIVGLLVGVPVVLLMLLRINATLVFLSLCLGSVLVKFLSDNAITIVGSFSAHPSPTLQSVTRIVLLLAPVFIVMLFMIKSVRKNATVLNLLPSLGVGLLLLLLVEPLLTPGLAHNIVDSTLWKEVVKAEDLIVGVSAMLCLLFLILQRPKHHDDHKKHH
jgi:hypothetical protein